MTLWAAPTADGPVTAIVRVPGSKSQMNRALILAALAETPSALRRPLRALDTRLMADALRVFGTTITDDGDSWHVTPRPITSGGTIDCGLAGTVMRFVPPVATLAPAGITTIDGSLRARQRPMRPLIDALRALGARVDAIGGGLPLTVYGGGVPGGRVTIDASASSQFVSALLLTSPRWSKGVEVHHVGAPLPSLPHVNMTIAELRAAGADVDATERDVWRVASGPLAGRDLVIEPDLSNAAPFLAAAVATGGSVTVADWPDQTTQAGAALPDLLAAMGATVSRGRDRLTIEGPARIDGLDADLANASELLTVVAALAALGRTASRIRGVAHARGHETNRLAGLAAELTALGGDVEETVDGLVIRPRPLHAGVFRTYDDHRLATAAAVIGLVVPGIEIENVETTTKTLPDFVERWLAMLGSGV